MRKTNFRKATLSALLMLVVAVVSLTGVTYAWFTSGNDATVSDINVSISDAEGGLLISDNNKDWNTSIDFKEETNNLKPVSTVGDINADGEVQFFIADLADDPKQIKNLTEVTGTNGYYVAKDIYFNNYGGKAKDVTFSYEIKGGDSENAYVASRIALVFRGNINQEYYTQSTENFASLKSGTITIFEPYATTHTLMGLIDAAKANQSNVADIAHPYYGIKKENVGEVSRYGLGEQVEEDETAPGILALVRTETKTTKENAFTISAESFAKLTIYVWIEGQDYDCQNDISGEKFNLTVKFAVPEAE